MKINRIWFVGRVILHWMGADEGYETMDVKIITDDPCYFDEGEDEHFIAEEVKSIATANDWARNMKEATRETRGDYVLVMIKGHITYTRTSGIDGEDDDQEVYVEGPTDDWLILSPSQCDALDEQLGINNERTD